MLTGVSAVALKKQDIKSLTGSLTTKTRVIKDLQDKCHALNNAGTLGAPGVRGGARGGGGGHCGGRGGGGASEVATAVSNDLVPYLLSRIFRVVGGEIQIQFPGI